MEHPIRFLAVGLIVAVGMTGCSELEERTRRAEVDTLSSGRVMVRNLDAGEPGSTWRVAEDLRIGSMGDGGAEVFGRIDAIASDSRGRIYVLDAQHQEIRVFDERGRFSHTVGGRGSGPGEFTFADFIAIGPADTLLVRDDGEMRYSLFRPDGTLIRTARRDILGKNRSVTPTVTRDGIVDWAPVSPDGRGAARFQYQPIRTAKDFRGFDSFPPLEYRWTMLPSGRRQQTHFDNGIVGAIDVDGSIWFARASEYRIFHRRVEGDTTLVLTMPGSAVPVGEEQREEIRERYADRPDLRDEMLETLPDSLPVVEGSSPTAPGESSCFRGW